MKLRKLPSRIKRKLRELPVIEAIANRISDRRFRAWQRLNPGRTFGEYYAAKTVALLDQGRGHYTLGGRGKLKDHGAKVEWTADDFSARALDIWATILGLGLTPQMKCVDYGCGSLRLGQHAMRYLAPGHYCGMDVVDTFINQGLALIDPALVVEKAPRLLTITPQSLSEIAEWRPDFIFSSAVLQHVPPDELPEYFRRLVSMMSGPCTAHILYIGGHRLKRVKALNWVYPLDQLLAALAAGAPELAMVEDRVLPELGTVEGRSRRVLTLRRR
ncbi:MAG: hypothetical protein ABIO68_00595 [Sphingomicrobium sp.]